MIDPQDPQDRQDTHDTNPDLQTAAAEHTPVLKRGKKHPTARTMHFEPAASMRPLPDALERIVTAHPAREAVDGRPDVVLWCGNDPHARLVREDLYAARQAGWTYAGYHSAYRSVRLARAGRTIELRSSAPWFGREADPETIRAAWYDLSHWLRVTFGEWAYLWPTPTMTGQELLRGTLGFSAAYPVLPAELLELLLRNLPGGRVEVLTAPGGLNGRNAQTSWLPALWNLDMRWAYASCLHNLPSGAAEYDTTLGDHDLTEREVGYAPCFYWFRATVPESWRHIGLLPKRTQAAAAGDGPQTTYPYRPGERFCGWATGAEVQLAVHHGWAVRQLACIRWPYPLTPRHDPLGEWITKLRGVRERVQRQGLASPTGHPDPLARLVAGAVRNLVVHTVGSFNRVSRLDEGFAPYSAPETIPALALPVPATTGDGWTWRREVLAIDEWTHPEWFHTVAGRVRAKLAKRALELPPESVISLSTDGIITSREPNVSAETGAPGSWRVKWHLAYAVPAPRSRGDVLALLDEATRGAGDLETDHRELDDDEMDESEAI